MLLGFSWVSFMAKTCIIQTILHLIVRFMINTFVIIYVVQALLYGKKLDLKIPNCDIVRPNKNSPLVGPTGGVQFIISSSSTSSKKLILEASLCFMRDVNFIIHPNLHLLRTTQNLWQRGLSTLQVLCMCWENKWSLKPMLDMRRDYGRRLSIIYIFIIHH